MTKIIHNENLTDEQIYQILKKNKDKSFISAKEWKKLRLKELKKEGKEWSK